MTSTAATISTAIPTGALYRRSQMIPVMLGLLSLLSLLTIMSVTITFPVPTTFGAIRPPNFHINYWWLRSPHTTIRDDVACGVVSSGDVGLINGIVSNSYGRLTR